MEKQQKQVERRKEGLERRTSVKKNRRRKGKKQGGEGKGII